MRKSFDGYLMENDCAQWIFSQQRMCVNTEHQIRFHSLFDIRWYAFQYYVSSLTIRSWSRCTNFAMKENSCYNINDCKYFSININNIEWRKETYVANANIRRNNTNIVVQLLLGVSLAGACCRTGSQSRTQQQHTPKIWVRHFFSTLPLEISSYASAIRARRYDSIILCAEFCIDATASDDSIEMQRNEKNFSFRIVSISIHFMSASAKTKICVGFFAAVE